MGDTIAPPPIAPRKDQVAGNGQPDANGWQKWVRNGAFSLAFGVTVVLSSANIVIFNPAIQQLILTTAPVAEFSVQERLQETQTLLRYFRTRNDHLLSGYSEDERAHLAEVAGVFNVGRWLLIVSATVTALLAGWTLRRYGWTALRRMIWHAARISGWVFLVLLALGLLNFEQWFVGIHPLLFHAAPWAFNPEVSKLVNIFPEEYFRNATAAILIMTAAVSWGLRLASKESTKRRPV
ncbi:MAG: DUF1461 domain-containing protein [Patescibacteria group bacterium]|nr:DUF1461 domain-containing protein [Patescibacteria group bacterium]